MIVAGPLQWGQVSLPWTLAALGGAFVAVGVLVRRGWGEAIPGEPSGRR
jgi:hypothetical protein